MWASTGRQCHAIPRSQFLNSAISALSSYESVTMCMKNKTRNTYVPSIQLSPYIARESYIQLFGKRSSTCFRLLDAFPKINIQSADQPTGWQSFGAVTLACFGCVARCAARTQAQCIAASNASKPFKYISRPVSGQRHRKVKFTSETLVPVSSSKRFTKVFKPSGPTLTFSL